MSLTDGPQPSGCISALGLSVSILLTRCLLKDAAGFRTRKVVRTLMQPEGCGPSVRLGTWLKRVQAGSRSGLERGPEKEADGGRRLAFAPTEPDFDVQPRAKAKTDDR